MYQSLNSQEPPLQLVEYLKANFGENSPQLRRRAVIGRTEDGKALLVCCTVEAFRISDNIPPDVATRTYPQAVLYEGLCCIGTALGRQKAEKLQGFAMSDFKGRRFPVSIILVCVRWYCKYGISYRDLEEMMAERGVQVDHTTLYRWVQRYAPILEQRIRRYQGYTGLSWRVDETYIKVAGEWAYLYRALDSDGGVIDFMLSSRRTAKAAARFLGKALKNRAECPPETINTDQNEAYGTAIRRLKKCGKIAAELQHRQVKYLNNRLEGDHAALKRVIRPMRGFKSMPTAYAAIKGIEVMRMIKKGNCVMLDPGVAGEVRFVNRLFYLPA